MAKPWVRLDIYEICALQGQNNNNNNIALAGRISISIITAPRLCHWARIYCHFVANVGMNMKLSRINLMKMLFKSTIIYIYWGGLNAYTKTLISTRKYEVYFFVLCAFVFKNLKLFLHNH